MIVGTAGHIDHGKTSLVKALTGVDTDRLKEEKARGITIELGFAYTAFAGEAVTGFIDVPGHERFVHTMLAGAGGIDVALLVIAADDGIKPQTREHLAILDLLGITRGIVALTKIDLVDDDRVAAVTAEIAALLDETGLAGSEIVPVSVRSGAGLAHLKQRLADAENATRDMSGHLAARGRFRLAVDRCFTLSGAGTVVTGTILSGAVSVGDHVIVSPSGFSARVRSIHAQNRRAERGVAGQRCALNLAGEAISTESVHRGDMVVDPVLHAPSDRIDATLFVLPSEAKPIRDGLTVRLHHGSAETGARIVALGEPVSPGARGFVQLVLDAPIAAAAGDRFVLRDASAQRTIGGGRLVDLRPPLRRRRTPERLQALAALSQTDATKALAGVLDVVPYVVNADDFCRDRALAQAESDALLAKAGVVVLAAPSARYAVSTTTRLALQDNLASLLAAFHADNPDLQGLGRERLRLLSNPRLPADAFLALIREEQQAGRLVPEGAFVRLPGHEIRLTEAEEALYDEILPHLTGETRFRPPRVRDFSDMLGVAEPDVRRMLKRAARLGRVDEIRHDHFFTRETTAEMIDIIRDVATNAPKGEFTAGLFRDRVENGRKVAIEILEFFDQQGVTIRRGDLRRVNPHRLDLYRAAIPEAEAEAQV